MPITWKNIGSTVSGDEASLMTGAQESMTAGFGALNKVLEDRQKTKDDNWDQGKTNNTNAFMNKLTGAETPEELAEMQKRGEFQAMMNQYGAQIDQGAARTALDGRGQVLQDRLEGRQEYQDGQHNRGLRSDIQSLKADAYNGDESAIARLSALGVRDDGEALEDIFGAYDSGVSLDIREDGNARGWSSDRRANAQESRSAADYRRAEEQRQQDDAMNAALNEAALLGQDGTTLDRKNLVSGLMEMFPTASPEEFQRVRDGWNTSTAGRNVLSEADENEITTAKTELVAGTQMETNPFYKSAKAMESSEDGGYAMAQRVIDRHSGEGKYFDMEGNQDVSEAARKKIMELVTTGVDVGGRIIPIPEEVFDVALSNSRDDWTELDEKFEGAIGEIMETDYFQDGITNYAQYADEADLLEIRMRNAALGRPTN